MSTQNYQGYLGRTAADSDWRPSRPEKSEKRPNVVYIVLDDMGFSHLGCYGSNIETPNIDQLAQEGLRYNNFHTTAICSATRASLLTGANHHAVGVCALTESVSVPGAPNSLGHIDPRYGTAAEILKAYGYATFAVGKWHLSEPGARTQAGPFDNWPLGKGFDRYYGFLHPLTDQWHPYLYRDNTLVSQPKSVEEGYHLSEDLTDNAIDFVSTHINAYPEKPFFLYLAYGAQHSPHHAPKEYADRYRGKFDAGWDEIRRSWYARQKALGVIPRDAELTPRNELVPAWDTLPEEEKRLFARYMEVYAGFLTHTDEQIGRVIRCLERLDVLDDTLVVFLSDNGASGEGGQAGRFNETVNMAFPAAADDAKIGLENLDLIGTEYAHNHYPLGWANAGNTPFPWYKILVHAGGVKDPLIIRYPAAIADPGAVRPQYHHVSDVTPTVLDVLGLEKPAQIKGVPQKPFTGVSFRYTLGDAAAPTRKRVQYYEIMGNRGIWKDGWKAVVNHTFSDSYADDVWELYHTDADYSEAHDVAAEYPEKLRELQDEFLIEAAKNNVFPMLPGSFHSGKNAKSRHSLTSWMYSDYRRSFRFISKPFDLPLGAIPILGSHTVTARIDRRGDGVIFSSGGRFGGFVLYVKDGRLKYVYNTGMREWYDVVSRDSVPLGKSTVQLRFLRTGATTASVRIYLEGELQGKLEITNVRSLDIAFAATIGGNKYSPVSEEYQTPFPFDGEIEQLDLTVSAQAPDTGEEIRKFFAAD